MAWRGGVCYEMTMTMMMMMNNDDDDDDDDDNDDAPASGCLPDLVLLRALSLRVSFAWACIALWFGSNWFSNRYHVVGWLVGDRSVSEPVSYTHLTLPTIYSV